MIGNDCRCPGCGMCDAASEVERLRGALAQARAIEAALGRADADE